MMKGTHASPVARFCFDTHALCKAAGQPTSRADDMMHTAARGEVSAFEQQLHLAEQPTYSALAYSRMSEDIIMARLPPITSKDQVGAEHRATFDSIVQSRGAVQGPFTMFLHSPELAGRLAHLGAYVRFEGSLDMRVRVLAAMTVAREFEAVYVWGAQTGGARRLGVPEGTIAAIRENHSRGIPPEDAEIVEFTRQLLRKHRIDAATAASVRRRFGDDGFIQLTGAIGYYSMLAMTVNACELEAAPNAEVLKV
jgi:4-carboxymuconolactone decarboxylase